MTDPNSHPLQRGRCNTTGFANTAVGNDALDHNTTGGTTSASDIWPE